jgi:hypothetical protein
MIDFMAHEVNMVFIELVFGRVCGGQLYEIKILDFLVYLPVMVESTVSLCFIRLGRIVLLDFLAEVLELTSFGMAEHVVDLTRLRYSFESSNQIIVGQNCANVLLVCLLCLDQNCVSFRSDQSWEYPAIVVSSLVSERNFLVLTSIVELLLGHSVNTKISCQEIDLLKCETLLATTTILTNFVSQSYEVIEHFFCLSFAVGCISVFFDLIDEGFCERHDGEKSAMSSGS